MFISTCIQVSSVYHAVLQGVYLCMYMHNCILYLYCTGLPVHIYRVCEHVCMCVLHMYAVDVHWVHNVYKEKYIYILYVLMWYVGVQVCTQAFTV